MTQASITSPALSGVLSLSTVGLAVRTDKFNLEAARLGDRDGFFAAVKIAAIHVRHMSLGIGAPGAHLVRMFSAQTA